MIRVALIGEDPNDTSSIKNLLYQNYRTIIHAYALVKNYKGSQLDNEKNKKQIILECNQSNPDVVIFIRDCDGLHSENEKVQKRRDWYNYLSKQINCENIFLLNVYELEALILADIDVFNKEYGVKINFKRNVSFIADPKKFLMDKTSKQRKQFQESHCPRIFEKLRFHVIRANCKYFDDFINDFESRIGV